MIKSKADLQARFRTNSVPTEGDFADVIESGLNKIDDGLRRSAGDPLNVGGAGDTQELLSFTKTFDTKQQPNWKINQNPTGATDPGLNIYSGTGESRLFIQERSGHIGLNTKAPIVKLDVNGAVFFGIEPKPNFATKQGGYLAWNTSGGAGETNFINNRGEGAGGFRFHNTNNGVLSTLVNINGDGKVGIGLTPEDAGAKLDVDGDVRARGKAKSRGITLIDKGGIKYIGSGDTDTDLGVSDLGLYSTVDKLNVRLVATRASIMFFNNKQGESAAGNVPTVVINPDGKVGIGIGTDTPAAKLDVDGDIQARGKAKSKGITLIDKGIIKFIRSSDTDTDLDVSDLGLYSTVDQHNVRLVATRASILFYNNKQGENAIGNVPNMWINTDGNVGIGTGNTAPATKLDVGGDIRATGKVTAKGITLVDNGAIKRIEAGKDIALATSDLGLYSMVDKNNIRFVTVNAPYQFFINEKTTDAAHGDASKMKMVMYPNGSVGIGSESPNARLDVNGNIRASGHTHADYNDYSKQQGAYLTWNTSAGNGETNIINNFGGGPTWGGGFVFKDVGPTTTMKQLAMITRDRGLEVDKIAVKNTLTVEGKDVKGSDIRIKKDIATTDSAKNLGILNKLNITEYRFIDPANFGDTLRKGLIAQEVEAVFPEAVISQKGFLPGILAAPKSVTEANGEVTFVMAAPHQLSNGAVVKLQTPNADHQKDIKLIDDKSFSVKGMASEFAGDVVVYGKQIDDFKMIEYDRLYLLNLSVTQQLVKENESLKAKNASLEAMLATFEQRLSAIEKTKN